MAHAYLPELDGYGDAALPLSDLCRRKFVVQIRPGEEEDWPEFRGRHACQDVTGRWRDRHTYIVEGRRGTECVHCGRLRPRDARLLRVE